MKTNRTLKVAVGKVKNSRATPSLFGPVPANPNTKLLIYDLFQRGRVLTQDED